MGYGFLEKVYEHALVIELKKAGLDVKSQFPIEVYYENQIIGKYFADIVVNDLIILELKAAYSLIEEHESQLINYLKATQMELGFLMNFGKEAEYRRRVLMNKYKRR